LGSGGKFETGVEQNEMEKNKQKGGRVRKKSNLEIYLSYKTIPLKKKETAWADVKERTAPNYKKKKLKGGK